MPTILGERFQADTGIEVIIEETLYGEVETKTQTGFISGTLQDILFGHHRWLFINYVKGIYMEIDDLLASNPPEDFDDLYPSVMAGNSLDGKNFSFPSVVHPGSNISVNYNKTMLEGKGLPLPEAGWTMNDWAELARAAAEPDNGVFGLGFAPMTRSTITAMFHTPGAALTAPNRGSWTPKALKLLYDLPIHEEVTAWYRDLLDNRIAPRTADFAEGGSDSLFLSPVMQATHATELHDTVAYPLSIGDAFEIGAVLLPVGPEGRQGTGYEGNQHMINSNTAHPEEAWDLLKLYGSGEAGVIMVLEGHLQPNGHRSAWTDPRSGCLQLYVGRRRRSVG